MNGHASYINAIYSPVNFAWKVIMDDIEFEVRYIMINDKDARSHRLLIGEGIDYMWTKDILRIVNWKTIKQEEPWDGWNPDQPRNLAKTITVK